MAWFKVRSCSRELGCIAYFHGLESSAYRRRLVISAAPASQPVSQPSPPGPRISRRTLLKAGVAGGAALILARWLYTQTSTTVAASPSLALDTRARTVVAAIVPVMLQGALPDGNAAIVARDEVVAGVDRAVAGLPLAVRNEVGELFALLAFPPGRCLIAGVWSPWPDASHDSIAAFLVRWRDSRFALLRSGFEALHRLITAAWYGNQRAWQAIDYPGPPSLESA